MLHKNNFFILTGGPGAGKTSVIDELQRRGYDTVAETGRKIIRRQIRDGGNALPWKDAPAYAAEMLIASVNDFHLRKETTDLCFFDRGIPDIYAYQLLENIPSSETLEEALINYRYNRVVFIFLPWKAIYETDTERKQTFQIAQQTCCRMEQVYKALGYELVPVPFDTVTTRTDFILKHIADANLAF